MIPLATIQQYVSTAVGTPIVVACEPDATFGATLSNIGEFPAGLDGYVLHGADGSVLHVIHVRQSVCDAAMAADRKQQRYYESYFSFRGQRMDADTGAALEVLLHEAMHVALQSGDESVVECTAFQNRWSLVKQFRLTAWIANAVMAGMAWRHDGFPAQYHAAGGC